MLQQTNRRSDLRHRKRIRLSRLFAARIMSLDHKQIEFDLRPPKDLFSDLAPHIVKAFWKYHRTNPHIFPLVKKYADQLRAAGRKNYAIVAVFERIRWHLNVETQGDDFKLNNNYRSCYARLLVHSHPEFDGFFRTRTSPGTVRRLDS